MAPNNNIFELCPKTFTFFYNFIEKDIDKKYYIIEGFHRYLPFWHDAYDEETMFYYKNTGVVEIHKEKTIKVIYPIDGGYSDDEIDYYIIMFSEIESENENGLKSKLPYILKLMFEKLENYGHKDTPKGKIFTEADLMYFND